MVELQADAYYYKIIKSKKTDISEYLPSPNMKNFAAIMERIIEKLKDDLEAFKELSLEDPSNKEVKQDIVNLQSKISLCQNHLTPKSKRTTNNIIFATTASGNVFPKADLKNIDREYFQRIYASLSFLLQKKKTSDPRKQKLLSGNSQFDGVREIKGYKTRMYYYTLPNDNYYVFLIKVKKDDWSKEDNDELLSRIKKVQKEYEYYSAMNSDELEIQLAKNAPICEEIINTLKNNLQRGEITTEETITDEEVPQEELTPSKKLDLSSLDSLWLKQYKAAKYFYETNGTINIKTTYTLNGFQLGKWVKAQKDAYDCGKLTELQIKLLEDLEIKWHYQKNEGSLNRQESPIITPSIQEHQIPKTIFQTPVIQNKLDQKWHQKYLLAKQFYEANGHLRISYDYEVSGVKLGYWIDTQRQTFKKGKMKPYRQKLLNEIAMIWAVYKSRTEKVEVLDLEESPKIISHQSPDLNETINQIYSKLQSLDQEKRALLESMIENDDETLIQIDNNHKRGK